MHSKPMAASARADGDTADAAPDDIVAAVLAFIESDDSSEAAFDTLALRLHAWQHARNEAYRRLCRRRGATPRTVKTWRDIPAVPIDAFKELDLGCTPATAGDRVFMTSGTTRGELRGRHRHPTLAVYDRSMTRNFARRFMAGRERIRIGILFPDETALPNSSLAHYLALARREFGTAASRHFVDAAGLQTEPLLEELRAVERSGEPYALLGASYSFVHLLEQMTQRGREHCINMYGMTELSTQFYDAGNGLVPSVKSGPHWIRSRLVDPASSRDVAPGERGILVHCDLANFNSVTTILTEDVGVASSEGFRLLGRAEGAAAKGCSLAAEELLRAARA